MATALATAPALAIAPASKAAVPRQLAVVGDGATATIQTNPFRLQVAAGRHARLGELANTRPGPTAMPPTADPVAPGTDAPTSHQLYAPLSYLVGTETLDQYVGGVWAGNLTSGIRQGTQFAARRVTGVRHTRHDVILTVSTNDPSRRTLMVTIARAGPGLIRVSATLHSALGVAMMSDAFTSTPSEAFHGFGGPHNAIDQHGVALSTFDNDENIAGLPIAGLPGTTGPSSILYPNGPTGVFYSQAQFTSSSGYGFLLDQPQLARFRLDSDRPNAWSVAVSAPSISYVVAPGAPARAITDLTQRTGRQPTPPAWALGPMLDRLVKNGGTTMAQYEASLNQDIVNIDRYHLPLTAYRIEGWNMQNDDNDALVIYHPRVTSFATQQKIIRELHARHIHVIAYLRPFITPGSKPDLEHLTIRKADGTTYTTTGTLGQHIALLDFSNPRAVAFWKRELAKVFDYGFDGFHADFGEEVIFDMHFANGQTGRTMHNEYRCSTRRRTGPRSAPTRRPTRTGSCGSSTGPATRGAPARRRTSTPTSRAMRRRTGARRPGFSRSRQTCSTGPSVARTGSPPTSAATTTTRRRRPPRNCCSAGPSGQRSARCSACTAPAKRGRTHRGPTTRRRSRSTTRSHVCTSVLVAPIVRQGATSRSVYFPSGCWRDSHSHRTYHGRRAATVTASLATLPYFFRCGTRPF